MSTHLAMIFWLAAACLFYVYAGYLIALALITYVPEISLIGVRYLLARG